MIRGRESEQGAIAILLSVVVLFVLLPLSAAGLSAYVRSGTAAELQRSADTGALAGARIIPLGNTSALPPLTGPLPSAPLDVACTRALAALDSDDAIGDGYASGTVSCEASWIYDPSFVSNLGSCMTSLTGLTLLNPSIELARDLLPALHHPGVQVELSRTSEGPLDTLVPGSAPSAETKQARAIRRFKNAINVPVLRNAFTGQMTLDLNANLEASRTTLLSAINQVGSVLSGIVPVCSGMWSALADDIADLYQPSTGNAPTVDEVIADARSQGTAVMAFVMQTGTIPCLTCGLSIPVLEFVPLCVASQSGSIVTFTSCVAQAEGAFRASLIR
ncbi:MAG TPA: hypothetical protein VNC78_11070 [Actinomycetota bacterium]|nr:hypothetical protein [Actinomycetota bacterium]